MDKISPAQRSANMAKIRGRDTKPEMIVRRLAHRMGYRYRLHQRDLPGKPDLVFESRKAVIFVHGCFWHQHADPLCKNAVLPKSRTEFWHEKLGKNVERDASNFRKLRDRGYKILVVWECETRDMGSLSDRLKEFLGGPKLRSRASVWHGN